MYKINFILLLLLLVGCSSEQQTEFKETPPIPVIVVTPTLQDIPIYVESIGRLLPSITMDVCPQVSGTLKEVYVKEGQWVKKNQPLLLIDPSHYAIKVKEAEAQLAMDYVEFEAARKKAERFRQLAQKDLVAQTEWDALESQAEKTKAQVLLGEARLQEAQNDLQDCTLTAPTDGRVGKLDVHPGLIVHSSPTGLVKISKMDPLIVEFYLTEKEFFKIPSGDIEFEVQSLCISHPGKSPSKGKITFFDNHYDEKSGQLLVRGTLPNEDGTLRPGQNVCIKIPVSKLENALIIPQKAIRYNDQGTYIYIVDSENTVKKRQIILGDDLGNDVIVEQGLDANEKVVTDGHLRVMPESKVEVHS